MTEEEIERVAKDYIERGRSDVYGRPNLGDWDYIKANKPIAYAEAIRMAKWALSVPRKEDDASLIAAAPYLLEACKSIEAYAPDVGVDEFRDALRLASTAIAKAEGRP